MDRIKVNPRKGLKVLDIGEVTVHVDGLNVSVVSISPKDGWEAQDESHKPDEAEVSFRNGDGRVDFKAEISDGKLRIRIRDRRAEASTDNSEDDRDDDASDESSDESNDDDDRDDDDDSDESNDDVDDDDGG